MLYSYEPTYIRATLEETLLVASNSINSTCSYIDYILRVKVELDARIWWILKKSDLILEDSILKGLLWLIFVIVNTIGVLGINRFIVEIVYRLNLILLKLNDSKK